jgi:hypothetical protein
MAIREATTSVAEPRPAGQRPDRRRRRRDLGVGPFRPPPRAAPVRLGRRVRRQRLADRRPKQVQNRLALLRTFSDDVAAQVQQETAEWVLEFQSNLLRLERERSNGVATRPGSVPLPSAAEP